MYLSLALIFATCNTNWANYVLDDKENIEYQSYHLTILNDFLQQMDSDIYKILNTLNENNEEITIISRSLLHLHTYQLTISKDLYCQYHILNNTYEDTLISYPIHCDNLLNFENVCENKQNKILFCSNTLNIREFFCPHYYLPEIDDQEMNKLLRQEYYKEDISVIFGAQQLLLFAMQNVTLIMNDEKYIINLRDYSYDVTQPKIINKVKKISPKTDNFLQFLPYYCNLFHKQIIKYKQYTIHIHFLNNDIVYLIKI
jgi:hypothetical protein